MGAGVSSTSTTVAPNAAQSANPILSMVALNDAVIPPPPTAPNMFMVAPIAGPTSNRMVQSPPVISAVGAIPASESGKIPAAAFPPGNADNNMPPAVVPVAAPAQASVSQVAVPVLASLVLVPTVADPDFPAQQPQQLRNSVVQQARPVQGVLVQGVKPAKNIAQSIALEPMPTNQSIAIADASASILTPAPIAVQKAQTTSSPAEANQGSTQISVPEMLEMPEIPDAPTMLLPKSSITTLPAPDSEQSQDSGSAVQQFQASNSNPSFSSNTTATLREGVLSALSAATTTTSALMIPSNNAKLFTPQLPASTIATSANLESGDMAAPMISTLLMVLVPIAVAVLLGFVLAVWCVRRSSNRQASNECDTEAAPAAAWSNQGRRLSQDVLLQFAPPPEYAYARRGSVVSTSSKIEDEEGDDETYALSVSTGLARLELERVHRMSMFSELTYETTKSTPSPAVQYKRPSDEEIPEILMVSSEVVRIINTPATDVVSSRAEDTPPVKQVGPLKIMFGFVYFERRRWPVAKAAGGRWVWIGENTQVYRGPYDEEVEVTILSGRKDAEAVFHEERLSVQGVDPKLILHWEILLTFF